MNEEILVKYMVGESDTQEREFVEQWLSENPENERYYQRFLGVWQLSQQATVIAPRDEHAAWERFKGRLAEKQRSKSRSLVARLGWVRIAAVLLACLSIGAILYGLHRTPMESFTGQDLATTHSVLHDTLADGTVVTLNSGSAIHVAAMALKSKRVVNMGRGEVFFNVARDEKKPFEVTIDQARVTVLGTSFNIKKKDNQIEIIVSSGLVNVQHHTLTRNLAAGQRMVIDQQDNTVTVDEVSDQLYQYYVNNRFVLKNTPLAHIVEVLAEVYGQPIRVAHPELGKLTLTATFERDSLEQILNVIAETLGAKVVREQHTWVIR